MRETDLLSQLREEKRTGAPVVLTEPSPASVEQAKLNPGGWVTEFEGNYGPEDAVPPEAVIGAWKVNEQGEVVGSFVPNPRYVPKSTTVSGDTTGQKSLN